MSNKQLIIANEPAARAAEALYPSKSLVKRYTQAATYGLTGGWFSPLAPLIPQHPETAGRALDYLAGYNLATRPRRDSGIDFWQLRNFAQFYDILRLVIETRKDQIAQFDWAIVPRDKDPGEKIDSATEDRIDYVTNFWKKPDGEHTWHIWLRAVCEDLFVLDANCFWPVYQGATPLKVEMVDPSTIKKVIDESGRTPAAPLPAYQQVLKGIIASEYSRDELLYYQRNFRTNSIYGFSPVEQILMTVNIGLRREVSQLAYFTEGNIPEAIAGVPDTWTPDQIGAFQSAWEARFAGDLGARRKLKFVPGDAAKIQMLKGSDALLKNEFDEWLVRIICYCFSVSPQPFVKQMNRATAETAKDEAREEGLQPLLDYLKDMIDDMIQRVLFIDDLEFKWNMEQDEDPDTQSQIDDRYIKNGTWSIDEVRQKQGLEPLGIGNMIFTQKGPIPVDKFADGSAIDLLFQQPQMTPDEAGEYTDGKTPPGKGGGPQQSGKKAKGKGAKQQSDASDKEAGAKSAQKFRKGKKRISYAIAKTDRSVVKAKRTKDTRGAAEDRDSSS